MGILHTLVLLACGEGVPGEIWKEDVRPECTIRLKMIFLTGHPLSTLDIVLRKPAPDKKLPTPSGVRGRGLLIRG